MSGEEEASVATNPVSYDEALVNEIVLSSEQIEAQADVIRGDEAFSSRAGVQSNGLFAL